MEDRERKSRTASDRTEGMRRPRSENWTEAGRQRAVRSEQDPDRERAVRDKAASARQRAARSRTAPDRERAARSQAAPERERAARSRTAGERQRVQRNTASSQLGDRRQMSRRPPSKRRRKRSLGIKIALLIILILAAAAAIFLWKRYSPSKEEADRNEYYGIENENQMAVIVDNQVVEPYGMISDGKAYVQYEVIRDNINDRFYWDPNENILLYTLPNDTVSVGVGSKDYTISKEKDSKDYVILKTEGSTAYIALDFVQQYTNIEYEVYDKPSRVMIVSDWGETTVATVKKDKIGRAHV